jgi:hypothetical protein
VTGLIALAWVVACGWLLWAAINDKRGPRNVRLAFVAVFAVVLAADAIVLADIRASVPGPLSLASLRPVPVAIGVAAPLVVLAVWTAWRLRSAAVMARSSLR